MKKPSGQGVVAVTIIGLVGIIVLPFTVLHEGEQLGKLIMAEREARLVAARWPVLSRRPSQQSLDFPYPATEKPTIRWATGIDTEPVFVITYEKGCSPWPTRSRERFDEECRYIYIELSGGGTLVVNRHTGATAACSESVLSDMDKCPKP